jgi:hypothetical protein
MTELFIDGVQAVLPKDFSIQVKRENPLITKNGEYTYEITLQLTNATNAELYAHLNRLNSVQEVKTKRAAILVADNRVYCNGTEIITGWTDDTVSLQIASGNSELNYFVGGDLLIGTLEMKRTDVLTTDMFPHIEKTYPEVEYCLAPVLDQGTGNIHNQWCVKADAGVTNRRVDTDDMFEVTPQPYLCAYIKELMRALGYGLTENQLENTVYKDVYICHTVPTVLWNKMLPGWSVKDFLEQVERLFNAVFLVDNRKRTARLLLRGNYFTGGTSVHVQNVEDVYEVEVEEPDIEDATFSNVEYKLPDSEFWRWRCLSDAVNKAAKRDTIPADYVPERYERIQEWFMDSAHQLTDTIYKDLSDGREYLYLRNHAGWENEPDYAMVNEFMNLERENATTTLELEMIPVELAVSEINRYQTGDPVRVSGIKLYLPVISSGSSEGDTTMGQTLEEMITNNTNETSSGKTDICLAFYSGMAEVKALGGLMYPFPRPYIDEYIADADTGFSRYYQTNTVGASLRLVTMNAQFYQGSYDIDYTKAVKVQSHDPNVYAAYQVFEIRNKRYVCKEMEFTLDAFGRKGAWTGTFYPIRISDTEADVRWILADGRWRDGGVWLDNSRWLDG